MILESAAVEHLEFDGNTVLCRVCGDKASGFHYGVHACEGCKGFFRRSIQQKIQYRPCLKNQQCNIMRVNRNRCQYCRLKKCISVGMSRDAVRFGRVPKKEKAKIMEQMKRVNAQSQMSTIDTALAETDAEFLPKIINAHFQNCDYTKDKLRELSAKAWSDPDYISCPAHMACPLNPRPTSLASDTWNEFSEFFTPAIRNVVNFAKLLPGFELFSQEDQVTLLKAGTFEVLLVHLSALFDSKHNTMMFANGKLYKREQVKSSCNAGFLLDSMFDFSERMNSLGLNDEELALFSAAVIVAPDRPGIRNIEVVERVQNKIHKGLQTMLSINHPDDQSLFNKLIMKIPDLRTLNTLHSEKLLGTSVTTGPEIKEEKEPVNERPQEEEQATPTSQLPRSSTFGGSMPMLHGMVPFPSRVPPSSLASFTASSCPRLPDLRRDVLEASYGMLGHLPYATPPLIPGWPNAAANNYIKNIPFWAQLAAANTSMCPMMGADRVATPSKDLDDGGYRERKSSNASSLSGYTTPQKWSDDGLLTTCPRRSSAAHTIARSPSLENLSNASPNISPQAGSDDRNNKGSRRSSSPDPIDLDIAVNRDAKASPPSLSPINFHHEQDAEEQRRKRPLPSDRPMESEPKMPKIHALWEYDMRSSRSNSISSSSSLESADSAYRTISNPGTPRSSMGSRSPYPHSSGPLPGFRHRAFTEPKQSFNPFRSAIFNPTRDTKSISPSPLAMGYVRSQDEARRAFLESEAEKKSSSPVLKTALAMPPLLGQEAWFHTPKGSTLTMPMTSSSALARSISQDTNMSEDIDVESIEYDSKYQQASTKSNDNNLPMNLKTQEPPGKSNNIIKNRAIDVLQRDNSSPTGSLPELPTEHSVNVPKRCKTASPTIKENAAMDMSSRAIRSTITNDDDNNTAMEISTDSITAPNDHGASSLSATASMQSMAQKDLNPALLDQYRAAMQQHINDMQTSYNRFNRSMEGSKNMSYMKKEPNC